MGRFSCISKGQWVALTVTRDSASHDRIFQHEKLSFKSAESKGNTLFLTLGQFGDGTENPSLTKI